MKDRVPKYPGRVYVTPENEGAPYYATIERADEPVEAGTPLNKATLLSDETAELYEKPTDTAVPDDMFKILGAERKRAIFGEKSEIESGIWDTYSYVTNNYGDELFRQITSDGKGRVIARMGGDSSDRIYYSDDYCETINPVSTPWDYSSEVFGYMGYVCGHFIIPNRRTESDPVILISKDGINWTEKTLDWNLSGDDRIGGNKRVIGNDDWGFIFAADEYSAGYTAIKITKSGGDLIFSKSSFGSSKEASYNDGVYVEWRTEGSVQISYTTGDPESSKTNLTRPPNMNSDDTVHGCIHVGGYIVMCWSGFYTGKKPAVSVYNISAGSWSDRLYTSDSTGDIYRIGASAGKALIFLDNGTDFWIVDPKTNTVEIKSVYFSSDVVLVTMYPEDGPTVSLFPAGLNASNIYGVYKSEITKSIEYRLVDLLGNYVGNGVKIETGEYTGTGTYGASNPNTLTFNFVPKLLIIRPSAGKLEGSSISDTGMIALYGSTAFNAKSSDGNSNALAEIVWSSTSASWSGKNADAQLNANNTKYLYIAIG